MKINSVDKAITVLNCFSIKEPILGVGEISQITGFTTSTVSRLLSTLEARDIVERAEGYGKYQLGYRIYLWGILSQKQNNLATIAKPIMESLRDECEEEISTYVVADNKRVCLERVASKHEIARVGPVGGVFPLHCGASGRVLLAFLPDEKRKEIIENTTLKKFTSNTITDPVKLEKNLKEIRKKGYAISKEEREPGAYSVVAPIRNVNGRVIASLTISGPIYRLSDAQLRSHLKGVMEAAKKISEKLGFI